MHFTSAICLVILAASASAAALPAPAALAGGFSECQYGRRIGCAFGKREAAPVAEAVAGGFSECQYGRRIGCAFGKREAEAEAEAVAGGFSECQYGRRIGCAFGKRDTVDETVHSSFKRAAEAVAEAFAEPIAEPNPNAVAGGFSECDYGRRVGCAFGKRNPVEDYCHSANGPCSVARRAADALASAVADEHSTPATYYHSLALRSAFPIPEVTFEVQTDEVTKRSAEAFCRRSGQPCSMVKRAAEAVADAMAEAGGFSECQYGRRIGCAFGKRDAVSDSSVKGVRSAVGLIDAAAIALKAL